MTEVTKSTRLLTLTDVSKATGLKTEAIRDLTQTGLFPKPVHEKPVLFVEPEVRAWVLAAANVDTQTAN
ncbi:MAG: AlpA family phage regulatory protein [Pseudomonadota bacterium]